MVEPKVGCSCEAFEEAVRSDFIERRDDRFFFADRQTSTGGGWSTLYGPEITHCPFCGVKLGEAPVLPRATVR